ncbi:glycosyltransferase [Amycolatopsis sp. Hca4]|uniref:glycosyltransferase n=1 Tax=Amycolatopsis sp. Hca4 TaxID=2742131 RepID=UPI0015915987|nr:glycosyltransferase [Amycolatopsis sp. Hca4]QKV80632.1 glycosyltransferase [Amycolatopsis sp. Hca4]
MIVLNDTQTAPLAAELGRWRGSMLWHAHIGTAERSEIVDEYWKVIGPSVAEAAVKVFYRPEFMPRSLAAGSVFASPGVDPSTVKNCSLDPAEARRALTAPRVGPITWLSEGLAIAHGDVLGLQISRWDPLKDMAGAVRVFLQTVRQAPAFRGLVVGPKAESASEQAVLAQCSAAWEGAPADVRSRVHIGVIDRSGSEEHDLLVRQIQSAVDVVLQKSIQEGFGLTVTEAMLRAKPVVASAIGGIPLQIGHDMNGVLVQPGSPDEVWVEQLCSLVADEGSRARLGARARADVLARHTVVDHLTAVIDGVARNSRSCRTA